MSKARTTYTVRAERSGAWWAISVDGIDGAFSQAKRLDQVDEVARDLIALMTDAPLNAFDIAILPEMDAATDAMVKTMKEAREVAARTAEEAKEAMARVSAQLLKMGLPMRDIGKLLGVSFQRVSQVATAAVREVRDAIDTKTSAGR